ncbi:MAG: YcfL family protein [Planctomycetes bacterium]|nr:YcfL family protein [Planctomycetota bacterium]
MKTITNILLLVAVVVLVGCYAQHDSRVYMREEVRSDSLDSNIVVRTVGRAFGTLIGEGVDVKSAVARRNDAGLLELHIGGYNRSHETKRFRYRVEWLDEDGMVIQNKSSVWMPASAMGKSPFSLKMVAPRPEAVNFRMDTRKWE